MGWEKWGEGVVILARLTVAGTYQALRMGVKYKKISKVISLNSPTINFRKATTSRIELVPSVWTGLRLSLSYRRDHFMLNSGDARPNALSLGVRVSGPNSTGWFSAPIS